jgi:hypothetical protein
VLLQLGDGNWCVYEEMWRAAIVNDVEESRLKRANSAVELSRRAAGGAPLYKMGGPALIASSVDAATGTIDYSCRC